MHGEFMDYQKLLDEETKLYLHGIVASILADCVKNKKSLQELKFKTPQNTLLLENCGAFVSYYKYERGQKALRGCVGYMAEVYPLWEIVARMAYAAAFEDSRFYPITEDELEYITWEITILTPFTPCLLENIIIGKHGILFELDEYRAVFLPQVATEQKWTKEETLSQLAIKAGLTQNAWQDPKAKFYIFEGIILTK